jgi:hypothetical protein
MEPTQFLKGGGVHNAEAHGGVQARARCFGDKSLPVVTKLQTEEDY